MRDMWPIKTMLEDQWRHIKIVMSRKNGAFPSNSPTDILKHWWSFTDLLSFWAPDHHLELTFAFLFIYSFEIEWRTRKKTVWDAESNNSVFTKTHNCSVHVTTKYNTIHSHFQFISHSAAVFITLIALTTVAVTAAHSHIRRTVIYGEDWGRLGSL